MSQELIYTSVPRGLRPGSSGFCTVAMTAQMPNSLVERLESLSAYRPVYQLGDPQAPKNPVNWAHWRVTIRDTAYSVISRVAFAEADYTGRSNKFAHHVVLNPDERPPAGPASTLRQMFRDGFIESGWTGEPRLLEPGRVRIPDGDRPAQSCTHWQRAAGDAGWAGILADAFRADPAKPAHIIYTAGKDILPLIEEALALLPPPMRWQVTFSTYFTDLPMGATCVWRCVVADSPAAKEALRSGARPLIIDLTKPLPAAVGAAADAARAGRPLDLPGAPSAKKPPPPAKTLGQIIPLKDDEPLELIERQIPTARGNEGRGRRRLQTENPLFTEEQSDEPEALTADDAVHRRFNRPLPAPARRGVPVLMAIAIGLIFFAIGGATVYFVEKHLHQIEANKQPEIDAITSKNEDLTRKNKKLADENLQLADSLAAANKAFANYKGEHPEASRSPANDNPKLLDFGTHQAPTTDKSGIKTGTTPKAEPGQPSPAPTPNISPSTTLEDKTQSIPHAPDRAWLFDHIPLPLAPDPPNPINKSSQSWQVDGEYATIFFPNGEAEYTVESRTFEVVDEKGTADLKVVKDGKSKKLGSFKIAGKTLTLKWEDSSFKNQKAGDEPIEVLKKSTILVGKEKNWTQSYAFPRELASSKSGLFGTPTPRKILLKVSGSFSLADLAPAIVIPRDHPLGGWTIDQSDNSCSIISQGAKNGHQLTIDFKLSADAPAGGTTNVYLTMDNQRQAMIDGYNKRLTQYETDRGPLFAPAKTEVTRQTITSDLDDLKKRTGGDDKPKPEITERITELALLQRELESTINEVAQLEAINDLDVEVRLRNGILLGQATLTGLEPGQKWTPK